MTPLRYKMISALELKNYAPSTKKKYINHVIKFAKFFGKCPSELGPKEIEEYLHFTLAKNYSSCHYRQIISALRFFYRHVLFQDWMIPHIPFPRKNVRKIPKVLSIREAYLVLEALENLKSRAIIATLYGTGLRSFELQELKCSDINSKEMLIHVRKGKWDKERFVMLPKSLLILLREYYKEYKPREYLFEGKKGKLSQAVFQRTCREAGKVAKIEFNVTPRMLRHCFATHLLEAGTDILTIKTLLGHSYVATTQIYTHVTNERISGIRSPLDRLL